MTDWMPVMIGDVEMEMDRCLTAVAVAMEQMFRAMRDGGAHTAPRTSMWMGMERDAQMLTSPAVWTERGLASVKITTLTPSNRTRGLPLINGIVALIDLRTGRVMALLEGGALTSLRTGAVAAMATRLCATGRAGDMAVVGAGVQAKALIQAMAGVLSIKSVRLYSRTPVHTRALAEWTGEFLGSRTTVTVCRDARDAVRDAAIVCTATSTSAGTPLVDASWVAPGAHLNVVGGTHENACEVAPSLLEAAFVLVEDRSAATTEAGEIRAAIADGFLDAEDLVEIGDLVGGSSLAGPAPGQTTVFRGVGLAIEDTAAAAAVYELVRVTREGGPFLL